MKRTDHKLKWGQDRKVCLINQDETKPTSYSRLCNWHFTGEMATVNIIGPFKIICVKEKGNRQNVYCLSSYFQHMKTQLLETLRVCARQSWRVLLIGGCPIPKVGRWWLKRWKCLLQTTSRLLTCYEKCKVHGIQTLKTGQNEIGYPCHQLPSSEEIWIRIVMLVKTDVHQCSSNNIELEQYTKNTRVWTPTILILKPCQNRLLKSKPVKILIKT